MGIYRGVGRSQQGKRGVGLVVLIVALVLGYVSVSYAETAIVQSYVTDQAIAPGSIVSLKTNTGDQIVPALSSSVDSIIGVVVDGNNAPISLSSPGDKQAQVATNGSQQVLVSTISGEIKKGDHITASPLAGVGMKANGNVRIVGISQGELTEKNGTKQSYKDKNNVEHTVYLGEVPTLINVSYYFKEPEKTIVPQSLQNVANALAGKSVSTLPVLVSAGIFLVTIVVATIIIYSMIRNSIISVGRNPMSQSAVYRDLIHMSILVLLIIGVGFTSIYLVLTRL